MKLGKILNEVIAHLNKKPATVLYPFERIELPDQYRGKIIQDGDLCNGCGLCEKDCPAFALEIIEVGEKTYTAKIDLERCIFCAQCVESCVKKALKTSTDYELAEVDPVVARLTIHELL